MEQYIMKGGNPLVGDVTISGAKNAALGILAASIMTDEDVVIENLPDVSDINALLDAIRHLGAKVERPDRHTVRINARDIHAVTVEDEHMRKIRASYYFIGALLGKYKSCLLYTSRIEKPCGLWYDKIKILRGGYENEADVPCYHGGRHRKPVRRRDQTAGALSLIHISLAPVVRTPVPRGLVITKRSPGCAPTFLRILSGCTYPVTQRPYLGSGSWIVWPPAMVQPASTALSWPPFKICRIVSLERQLGTHNKFIATAGCPPMAYTSLKALAAAICPNW